MAGKREDETARSNERDETKSESTVQARSFDGPPNRKTLVTSAPRCHACSAPPATIIEIAHEAATYAPLSRGGGAAPTANTGMMFGEPAGATEAARLTITVFPCTVEMFTPGNHRQLRLGSNPGPGRQSAGDRFVTEHRHRSRARPEGVWHGSSDCQSSGRRTRLQVVDPGVSPLRDDCRRALPVGRMQVPIRPGRACGGSSRPTQIRRIPPKSFV
jgi:hypothetical protein